MKRLSSKKGQVGLREVPSSVLLLGLAGVIGVILLILLSQVKDDAGSKYCANEATNTAYNTTSQKCYNPSNVSQTSDAGHAVNASTDAEKGIAEVYDNFDLIGLMIGLGVVLVVLIGAIGFIVARNRGLF